MWFRTRAGLIENGYGKMKCWAERIDFAIYWIKLYPASCSNSIRDSAKCIGFLWQLNEMYRKISHHPAAGFKSKQLKGWHDAACSTKDLVKGVFFPIL